MNNTDIVESKLKDEGVLRHNTYVYPKEVAIKIINQCKNIGIGILGIDAFIIKPNFHQPSMDNSIDFTTKPYNIADNTHDLAIIFLENSDSQFYFEIVV
jgi:hypothetical protein